MSSNNTTKDITINELETMNKEQLYMMIFSLKEESLEYKSHYEEESKRNKELDICFREEKEEKKAYKKQLEDIKKICQY